MPLSVIFLIASTLIELFGSSPQIIVSRETTVFTSPLTADGLPDFEKYFRDFGRKDVTFENNGAVLLWQASWPHGLPVEDQLPMSRALGFELMPDPTPLRDPLSSTVRKILAPYLVKHYQEGLTTEEALLVSEDKMHAPAERAIKQAMKRPWTEHNLPPLAGWIVANDSYFRTLHDMAKRPEWWNPSPSVLGGRYEGIPVMLLSGVGNSRIAVKGLALSSMWHAGHGRLDDAWDDLRVCFRLARFNSRGITLVEQLVAARIDIEALQMTVVLLQCDRSNVEFARKVLDNLSVLRIPSDVARSWNLNERIAVVEPVLMLATKHQVPKESGLEYLRHLSYLKTDWNYVLHEVNQWIDRLVEVSKASTPLKRIAASEKFEAELLDLAIAAENREQLYANYANSVIRSAWIADVIVCRSLPLLSSAIKVQDRAIAMLDLTRVAAALAVYRAEQGEYPEKLEQLVPSVLAEIPNDLYSGQPFLYERQPDEGYLLYSVFENGKDDGGTDRDGLIIGGEWVGPNSGSVDYNNSDLVIRVPVPKFEMPAKPVFVE